MRAVIFALLLGSTVQALAAGPANVNTQPFLRQAVSVSGEYVKLGDIFANLPEGKEETPVALAPQPGKRAVLDAKWLYNVALAQGIAWRPMSQYDRAIIDRPSQTIGRQDIEAELTNALAIQGMAEKNAIVELSNRTLVINAPTDLNPVIGVRDLIFDDKSRRFTATVEVPDGHPLATRVKVSGRVFERVEIPVPVRNIPKDDVITAKDIKFIAARSDDLRRDMAVEIDSLVGQAPKRMLQAGSPIRISDVQRPVLVQKGSIVTMTIRTPVMTLTSLGRALDQGGEGDTVRIVNTHSNQTVEATVEKHNQVMVAISSSHKFTN